MQPRPNWLRPADVADLRTIGAHRRVTAGTMLFAEGDESTEVLLFESGTAKITTSSISGRELVLDVVGAGEIVGELSAFDGRPRSATITSLTSAEITTVAADAFRTFVDERPDVMQILLQNVIDRLRNGNRRQVEFAASDALGRVCARLVELAPASSGGTPVVFDLPFTQTEFAQWCGLSREAIVKSFRKLKDLGWIEATDTEVTVLDLASVLDRGQI